MHYKVNEDHEWVENPRPYRKYWVDLMEAGGDIIHPITE